MYFVANYKLTTFVLKMIKKEEKRRVSILKRQMVVSKRVERARGREDDTELIISQHWLYTLQGTIAMRSFGLSKISTKVLMFLF